MKKYSSAIGKKFHEDGSPARIPGNTFICFVDESNPVMHHIEYINRLLDNTSFYKKYILLPPSSYHMTLIEGIIPEFIDNVWSSKLSKEASLESFDTYFQKAFDTLEPMKEVMMICTDLWITEGGCCLKLMPNSKEDELILSRYRDEIIAACGIRVRNNGIYPYHISLSYQWEILDDQEVEERMNTEKIINDYIREHMEPFPVPACQLTFFDTMFEFKTNRKDLTGVDH